MDYWIIFLVVVDTITAGFSSYAFIKYYLLPKWKYRHTKKNGIYTTFTLYDNGEYRGSIDLNISEIIDMLFKKGGSDEG